MIYFEIVCFIFGRIPYPNCKKPLSLFTRKERNLFFVGFSNYEKGIPITRSAEDVAVPGGESQFVKENFAQEEIQNKKKQEPSRYKMVSERLKGKNYQKSFLIL